MAKDMEGLQRAENALTDMQKELELARLEQENVATEKLDLERRLREAPSLSSSSSDLELQQLKQEVEMLRAELSRAEVELVDHCWTPPPALQSWLQLTFELESRHALKQRVSAEKQLQLARDACEKLKRKRASLVGAFVSTHGKSMDDVDRSIVMARNSLSEVTNEMQERMHRWKQIEQMMGFGILNNNGLAYLETVLYSRNGSGKSSRSECWRIRFENGYHTRNISCIIMRAALKMRHLSVSKFILTLHPYLSQIASRAARMNWTRSRLCKVSHALTTFPCSHRSRDVRTSLLPKGRTKIASARCP